MSMTFKTLPLIALLAFGTAGFAQETTTETAPAADAPAEATATGEPQTGQLYFGEESGDWTMRCLKTEEGDDPCQLYRLLQDAEGNNVAEISLFPLPEGGRAAAGASVVVPLDTLLSEGLSMSIDGGDPLRFGFTFCNTDGCVARIGFTSEELDKLKAGNMATLTLVPLRGANTPVALDLPLAGFTAGFEKADLPR